MFTGESKGSRKVRVSLDEANSTGRFATFVYGPGDLDLCIIQLPKRSLLELKERFYVFKHHKTIRWGEFNYVDPLEIVERSLKVPNQVYVPGFPYGSSEDGYAPVWKSCHIAYTVKSGDQSFIIDGLLCEGMSGSPIVEFVEAEYRGDVADLKLLGILFEGMNRPKNNEEPKNKEEPKSSPEFAWKAYRRSVIDELITDFFFGL